jgi:hypothetical protein
MRSSSAPVAPFSTAQATQYVADDGMSAAARHGPVGQQATSNVGGAKEPQRTRPGDWDRPRRAEKADEITPPHVPSRIPKSRRPAYHPGPTARPPIADVTRLIDSGRAS